MPNTILLVLSGNRERRETFVSALSLAGWLGVLQASSMAEAAGILRDATSACVIVDSELDDIPGLKAVPILRNLCRRIRIVFSTPQNTRELEANARALDVFYYHVGSSDRAELVAAVKDAIGAPTRVNTRPIPRVLIVDDDPDVHATLIPVLRQGGYAVLSAYSEPEGLAVSRRETPDIIILDIIMQASTGGFEFCREARRDPLLKHTPILGVSAIEMMTGVPRPPDFDRDLFPVDGYLSKPIDPSKLLAELQRLVPAEASL